MRGAITVLAIIVMLVVAFAVFRNSSAPVGQPTQTEHQAAEARKATETAPGPAAPAEHVPLTDAAATPAPAAPALAPAAAAAPTEAIPGLNVLPAATPAERKLGSTDRDGDFAVELALTRWGAGVEHIALADYRTSARAEADAYKIATTLSAGGQVSFPFAARRLEINGQAVPEKGSLDAIAWSAGEVQDTPQGQSVEYRISIADASGAPVVDVVRRYTVPRNTKDEHGKSIPNYDLRLDQEIVNRTDRPLSIEWKQNLQGDLTLDDAAYMGDRRMYVTGYFNTKRDRERSKVWTQDAFVLRHTLLQDGAIWPSPYLTNDPVLAWLASENRYFAVVTHTPVPANDEAKVADLKPLEEVFPRLSAVAFPGSHLPDDQRALVFAAETNPTTVAAGGTLGLPLAIFAGPRQATVFASAPYKLLGFDQLLRYELSCSWCTFQWLAVGLLRFLEAIHWVVRDWGVAIVILVLIVRALLHPLTKKAQVGMMKMSKQMQALQPEIEKIRKKYGEDNAKIQMETMRLYREKGVNFANMLGCLPMFLQTPIWIALYAMLYFAIELRHEPAFYGVFQHIGEAFGYYWPFLGDLSSADQFIPIFDTPQQINLWFIHLNFQSINILPLLMGLVFYFNMKFTSPPPPEAPPGGKLTEQQEMMAQQQRIMKIMFPIMMPFFLYSAPSGLTLYICASTLAGIVDSYIVRRHVREQEAAGKLFETKPRNPNGFMAKMARVAEQKQRELLERQQQMQRGKPRSGR